LNELIIHDFDFS